MCYWVTIRKEKEKKRILMNNTKQYVKKKKMISQIFICRRALINENIQKLKNKNYILYWYINVLIMKKKNIYIYKSRYTS